MTSGVAEGDLVGRRVRREIATAAGLLLVAGGVGLLASSRTWLVATAARPAPFGPLESHVSGRTWYPATAGLAVVLLLSAVLVVVTGRLARTVLGGLLIVLAVAAGWYATRGLAAPGRPRTVELLGGSAKVNSAPVTADVRAAWPVVDGLAAVAGVAGGALLLLRARRWNAGLSRRYEAPVAATPAEDPWRALDRGDDPTIADG